ncbi:hypothetical protein [Caballeronia sp. LZ019]|uniref:hypothetical protein n=1 Tax=Caballeronia sp. LZ019 TaxID=3038555 RepID=UPI00285CC022|nr:hypothetical protein [Caballeronia sp. LZ019]MDR5809077.1 hypothetical protein [Caballeronia sp. LZ019]
MMIFGGVGFDALSLEAVQRACAALFVFALFVEISGCVQTEPYRLTAAAESQGICDPDEYGTVQSACEKYVRERATHYDLLFAEFDDQGWANNCRKRTIPS